MTKFAMTAFALGLAVATLPEAKAELNDVKTHETRMIPMEGGRNVRDIGGYRTSNGRTVRWHLLYRSASLANLTPEGRVRLQGMNIRAMIDLRMTAERRQDQNNWLSVSKMGYWTRDYQLRGDEASLAQIFGEPSKLTVDTMRAMMTQGYRTMPKELAPQYRELFVRLSAPVHGAVVVNCTAGKDRTGIGVALVLTALGVPYETVREDYLLSNTALDMDSVLHSISPQLASLPPEVVQPLISVEAAYLDAAFAQIKIEYGSIEAYLERELGVGPAEIETLKRRMLN
jgi:protein-tyrosine phosphatase